ncbi:MAG: YicC/YloC family endoribonuclease [Candidatus Omnitrophota bacterium]
MTIGMTGFGQAQRQVLGGRFSLEIKSLNHKFLDTVFHLPPGFGMFEEKIKKQIRKKLKRGRVVVSLSFSVPARQKVVLNKALARDYFNNLKTLNRQLGLKEPIKLSDVVGLSGIVEIQHTQVSSDIWPKISSAVAEALENLMEMRKTEGMSIYNDIFSKLKQLQEALVLIPRRAKIIISQKSKFLAPEELPLFLKSADINEEVTRLKYHVNNFRNKLKKPTVSGKELDFISQELQREINTVGAKLPDTQITTSVIKIKDFIEKIREQLQNVE